MRRVALFGALAMAPLLVSCGSGTTETEPPTGDLRVVTATSGEDLDGDGYRVALDGGPDRAVGLNDTLDFTGVALGPHTIRLTGVAANCLVNRETVQRVLVASGSSITLPFGVLCLATSGKTGQLAYVGDQGGEAVWMIDAVGGSKWMKRIAMSGDVWGMTVSPDGAFAYAGLAKPAVGVAVLDARKGEPVSFVTTGDSGLIRNVVAAPDGSRLYAVAFFHGELIVIETATHTVVARVPEAGNEDVAPTPDGKFAYVVGNEGVRVVETAGWTIVRSVDVGVVEGIALTRDGRFAYLAQPGKVTVLETGADTVVASIETEFEEQRPSVSGFGQADIAITPDGALAYRSVTCCAKVAVIATTTNELVDAVDVPAKPSGVAVAPNGEFVYVVSPSAQTLSVIERATNTVVDWTIVGQWPINVALTPF